MRVQIQRCGDVAANLTATQQVDPLKRRYLDYVVHIPKGVRLICLHATSLVQFKIYSYHRIQVGFKKIEKKI